MKSTLKILFVEDFRTDAELILRELNKHEIAFSKILVDNREDYLTNLETFNPDIVISDYWLPQFSGMEALEILKKIAPFTPFILITGSKNEEIAVEFMKAGADDYILTQNLTRLVPAINSAINKTGLLREKEAIEKSLQESYEFNDTLLKTIPFGMDIVDETGTILFLSEKFKCIFGEKEGKAKCWELYRDVKERCIDCPLQDGIVIGKTDVYESQGGCGGVIFEILHTGMIYKGKKAMLEIFIDITEKKNIENELIKAKEKAEESDRLKSAFLANISHEIRTPMNGILGFTELLLTPHLSGEEQTEYIGIIKQSGDRMLNIINDIVDISKIEAGLMNINTTESDINLQIEFVFSMLKNEAEKKKIRLFFTKGLASNEFIVQTDREKLFAILINLVKNAIKFTFQGSVEFGYQLMGTDHCSHLLFFVKDTGIGIPKDKWKTIFDRFMQADIGHKRAFQGAGLGLSISRSYVEMLGGKIWVESKEGLGSTFYFTLPLNVGIEEKSLNSIKMGLELPKLQTDDQ